MDGDYQVHLVMRLLLIWEKFENDDDMQPPGAKALGSLATRNPTSNLKELGRLQSPDKCIIGAG